MLLFSMFKFRPFSLFCLFCVLFPLIDYRYVHADEEENKDGKFERFIIEHDYKPAIFGSFSYDPIKGEFMVVDRHNESSQVVNSSYVLSTAVGTQETETESTTARFIRSNINQLDSQAVTAWWARKIHRNGTKIHQ